MTEVVDIYADQFHANLGPYGTTLNFLRSNATPPAPGAPPQADRLGTVRMSLEHLKVMVFILHRQLLQYEERTGAKIQIPREVLNAIGIGPEDWEKLWPR